ncbi:hypothetical protein [Amycolatopsis antarctica]|nr:hypothetical protein [Amycolatopsis antarctica]
MTTDHSLPGPDREPLGRAFVVDMQVSVTVTDERAVREYAHARIDEAEFADPAKAEVHHDEVEKNLAAAVRFVVGPRGAAGFTEDVPGLHAHSATHGVSEQPRPTARRWR